jgi:peroxiredoxin
VKSWASSLTGASRRQSVVRAALAVVLVAALVWLLPSRRPGEEGGHHAAHVPPTLDAFEKAGVTEFKTGQRGPGFRLSTLDGRHAALEDYGDKLVVLNFWATWCQPCTIEMPTLEALWREYEDRGLVVLGVSVDRGAPRGLIDPYVRNLKLTFPILLDPDVATATAWRVTGVPATFLVRPGGEVAGSAVGAREWNSEEMKALIETLLPASHGHRE